VGDNGYDQDSFVGEPGELVHLVVADLDGDSDAQFGCGGEARDGEDTIGIPGRLGQSR
jgi:hypothetical protein